MTFIIGWAKAEDRTFREETVKVMQKLTDKVVMLENLLEGLDVDVDMLMNERKPKKRRIK